MPRIAYTARVCCRSPRIISVGGHETWPTSLPTRLVSVAALLRRYYLASPSAQVAQSRSWSLFRWPIMICSFALLGYDCRWLKLKTVQRLFWESIWILLGANEAHSGVLLHFSLWQYKVRMMPLYSVVLQRFWFWLKPNQRGKAKRVRDVAFSVVTPDGFHI